MISDFDYWKLFAGLGIFLFGMQLLEQSVKDLSGRAFRRIIRQYTNTRLKAILNGTFATALLQSSSAVSLMVLAFVGAGVMNMENAIGIILGSNIGTTFTAWIVATLGFKIKIETFALPFIGLGALGTILFKPDTRACYFTRMGIGFGFLFLGLDYMKSSVESFAAQFDMTRISDLGPWLYLVLGALMTAVMQASAATIAIVLTALNSRLMTFEMGAAMIIGANIGTTVTVLLGSIGGTAPKKRVAASHLVFNLITGLVAFMALPAMVRLVDLVVDIRTDAVVALAFFHTLFNVTGVLIFTPLIGLMSALLIRFFPEHKAVLTVYIDQTPAEEVEAASAAFKQEMHHLLQECQLYMLRVLKIDDRLVFEEPLPFEAAQKKKQTLPELYSNIKLLHSSIITYYSRIQNNKLDEAETREFERVILASRNIMNALKNAKSISTDLDEFESSDSVYLNRQYIMFRKRLITLYHGMADAVAMEGSEARYGALLDMFKEIETADKRFIESTLKAVADKKIQEMEIASLFMTNRLFTQSCRMQIYSLKDMLLTPEQIADLDRAMDI